LWDCGFSHFGNIPVNSGGQGEYGATLTSDENSNGDSLPGHSCGVYHDAGIYYCLEFENGKVNFVPLGREYVDNPVHFFLNIGVY